MPFLWAAFIMGLAGGMHCIFMCGPLASSALSARYGNLNKFYSSLLYQAGRICSYIIIGLAFGAIGKVVSLVFYQQLLSIIAGILLLLWVVFGFLIGPIPGSSRAIKLWSGAIAGTLSKLWKKKTPLSVLGLGALNGFLPCGLVYLAAAASLNGGNIGYSTVFMLLFGLGTLPAMIGVTFSRNLFPQSWRLGFKKMMPAFLGILAVLFILRGMDLNIPYLSPHIAQAGNGVVKACHETSASIPVCR